ncbi:hypothetical protein RJT34_12126 [Clitoria ternatea]|uniref:Uncharacterized protein n=1 Tax=Clitoria ternatea TaxID=43366 RepID=A0AAN9PJ15_CLITE
MTETRDNRWFTADRVGKPALSEGKPTFSEGKPTSWKSPQRLSQEGKKSFSREGGKCWVGKGTVRKTEGRGGN